VIFGILATDPKPAGAFLQGQSQAYSHIRHLLSHARATIQMFLHGHWLLKWVTVLLVLTLKNSIGWDNGNGPHPLVGTTARTVHSQVEIVRSGPDKTMNTQLLAGLLVVPT